MFLIETKRKHEFSSNLNSLTLAKFFRKLQNSSFIANKYLNLEASSTSNNLH